MGGDGSCGSRAENDMEVHKLHIVLYQWKQMPLSEEQLGQL